MRCRGFALVLAILVALSALSGCGDRNLVLKVDVLSYLDTTVTHVAFGPVPVVPGGGVSGEQPVISNAEINLLDGTESLAKVRNVSLSMTAIGAATSGSGADTLRLYMSDPAFDPLTTAPVAVVPLTLNAGVPDTVTVDLATDTRVAELFAGKRIRLTMTTSLRGPGSGSALNGTLDVKALDAVLVAGRRADL